MNFSLPGRISSSWTSYRTTDALIESSTSLYPFNDKKWIPNDASPSLRAEIRTRTSSNCFNQTKWIKLVLTCEQIQNNAVHLKCVLQELCNFLLLQDILSAWWSRVNFNVQRFGWFKSFLCFSRFTVCAKEKQSKLISHFEAGVFFVFSGNQKEVETIKN